MSSGVLRADPGRPEPPQPSLDRSPNWWPTPARRDWTSRSPPTVAGTPSDAVGRTCYRVVQEGLTNAAKHAPGAHVHVTLEGTAGGQLERQRPQLPPPPRRPHAAADRHRDSACSASTERVTLAGGKLDHHRTPDGGYVLTAQLPWPNPTHEKRT